MTTIQKLASEIAKREGLKKQVSIGNVREILKHIVKMNYDSDGAIVALIATQSAKLARKRG